MTSTRQPLDLRDFHRIADGLDGRTVLDAYAIRVPRSKEYEAVHLILDKGRCRIEVDIYYDEFLVFLDKRSTKTHGAPVSRTRLDRVCVAHLVGRKLGWSWTCYNSQGYRDALC